MLHSNRGKEDAEGVRVNCSIYGAKVSGRHQNTMVLFTRVCKAQQSRKKMMLSGG